MVTGKEKEVMTSGSIKKYVGLTSLEVKAINPNRAELNKLLGKEDSEDDKDLVYLSTDQEGNEKLRLSFWLYDEKINKYFAHSFNLVKKQRLNKDGNKHQYVNSTCGTSWSDTDENLQEWFTNFTDKDKNAIGKKTFRKALVGEEELLAVLKVWLGRMKWNDTSCNVMIDTDALFAENYSELRDLIDSDFTSPFVALLGIRTDESDSTKQYQQIYSRAFLPGGFMNYINNNFKFPTDYSRKTWEKFEKEVEGEYGFSAYFELVPLTEYDPKKDVAVIPGAREDVTPIDSKF